MTDPRHLAAADLGAAVLAGAATGMRCTTGLAALTLAAPRDRLPGALRSGKARAAMVALGLGELTADKLPVPSRVEPPGLLLRVAMGATSGGVIGRVTGGDAAPLAVTGAATAAGMAFASASIRSAVGSRMHPVLAAVLEDVSALALGALLVAMLRSSAEEPVQTADDPDLPPGEAVIPD